MLTFNIGEDAFGNRWLVLLNPDTQEQYNLAVFVSPAHQAMYSKVMELYGFESNPVLSDEEIATFLRESDGL